MKKNVKSVFALSVIVLSLLSSTVQSNADGIFHVYNGVSSDQNHVSPFKVVIQVKYKVINGKLYYRLYNTATDEWIGEWTLAE